MDSFKDICIQDGGLTAAGERASALVYERITGGCWHGNHISEWGDGSARMGGRVLVKHECGRCHKGIREIEEETGTNSLEGNRGTNLNNCNPPLATSLDAWMPLWKAMGNELMAELFGMRVSNRHLLDPMWWLEASLRACGLYEKWRADNG